MGRGSTSEQNLHSHRMYILYHQHDFTLFHMLFIPTRIPQWPIESRCNLSRKCIPSSCFIPTIMIVWIPLPLMLQLIICILTLNPVANPFWPNPRLISFPQLPIHPVPQPIRRNSGIWIRRLSNKRKVKYNNPDTEAAKKQSPSIPIVAHRIGLVQQTTTELLLIVELLVL